MCPVFQWVWRYSCLNVTHKKPYERYEGKTNDVLIAFIGYVNDLNKLQRFKVSVQKSHHRFQCTMYFSWRSCFTREALFIMRATNSSLFLCRLRFSPIPTDKNLICTRQIQIAVSSYPFKIGHMFI